MNRKVQRWKAWITTAILIFSVQVVSQAQIIKTTVFNLQKYGWKPPDAIRLQETDVIERRSILVDHENRILVSFVVRERNGLVTRDQPAFSFHIIRFSPDGQIDLNVSLPTNGWRTSSIYLSESDQIIARVNDSVKILRSAPQADSGRNFWETIAPCGLECRMLQSPSRRTIMLSTSGDEPLLTVIDTSGLSKLTQCARTDQQAHSITDQFAYSIGARTEKTAKPTIHFYRWPLCDYEHVAEMPLHKLGQITVLSDTSFVSDDGGDLELTSSDGQIEFREAMVNHESWDGFWVPIRSSERGDRIAVNIVTNRGGNRTLDISSHLTARRISVYDINVGKEVVSISVNARHRYRYEFDLGPDGHRLAILEDDVVRVVDLGNVSKTGGRP